MIPAPADALTRSIEGRLSANEAKTIAASLSAQSSRNAYTYLHALGHARAVEQEAFVRPFLQRSDDPMLSRMALQVLCTYWNLSDKYREEVARFVEGVTWDLAQGGYVQLAAVGIAGDLVKAAGDAHLATMLARTVLNDNNPTVLRDAAYAALLLAEGRPYDDLPSASRLHGPDTYDWGVVNRYLRALKE